MGLGVFCTRGFELLQLFSKGFDGFGGRNFKGMGLVRGVEIRALDMQFNVYGLAFLRVSFFFMQSDIGS